MAPCMAHCFNPMRIGWPPSEGKTIVPIPGPILGGVSYTAAIGEYPDIHKRQYGDGQKQAWGS